MPVSRQQTRSIATWSLSLSRRAAARAIIARPGSAQTRQRPNTTKARYLKATALVARCDASSNMRSSLRSRSCHTGAHLQSRANCRRSLPFTRTAGRMRCEERRLRIAGLLHPLSSTTRVTLTGNGPGRSGGSFDRPAAPPARFAYLAQNGLHGAQRLATSARPKVQLN